MKDPEILIIGAKGQLGLALQAQYPKAQAVDVDELDIADEDAVKNFDWRGIKAIINAAAYTNVDGCETKEGSKIAWDVNASAVANLAAIAKERGLVLVHISTDYVFDGTQKIHREDEAFNPLSVYGTTKAEGDRAVMKVPKHYLIRTSWVIGEGKNFVRTMLGLGKKGISPTVVADQIGRPTFTSELVRAIAHLLKTKSPYGTYNVSNDGSPISWAELTRAIFQQAGYKLKVTDTTTAEYFADKPGVAPRPLNSTFDLAKIKATGFKPKNWQQDLKSYIDKELRK